MPDEHTINPSDIAIIGMACRFPGASTVEAFWNNLCQGRESVTFFSDAELLAAGVDPTESKDPAYVKAGTVLPDYDRFDASFFGLTPRDAQILDPQHRLFLECAVQALEDAGYGGVCDRGRVGVYAGAGMNGYLLNNLVPNRDVVDSIGLYQIMMENDGNFLSTRVSYKLNLQGPSLSIQTGCSTSLVAVHLACQSLLAGECGMAIAGGVSVKVPHVQGYLYQPGMIFSPDGHCRAFAANAQGTIGGNGLGMVVLKRLAKAIEDGDTVHAVIKSTAINNDGARKVGYTAPSVEGQAQVIREAQALAGVEPETIAYIEAHGTGTVLGDPIEIAALKQAFRTSKRNDCAIGSVKSNIGHADAAAGVAGLIKAALSVKHGLIPASLHCDSPNSSIALANTPFYVNTTLREWAKSDSSSTRRRAGVSSFGVGGTNAHVILEEAPKRDDASGPSRTFQLILLSAKSEEALDRASGRLAEHLRQQPSINLADVAYTLACGREHHAHRQMVVCRDIEEAIQALDPTGGSRRTGYVVTSNHPIAFMFPGNGAQYVGMGRDLYKEEPVFRREVDRCAELLRQGLGSDLRAVLYPEPADEADAARKLDQPMVAHAALFVTAYANAMFWLALGVKPTVMIGHSFGEYVAATLAGVLSLESALTLVLARGRLIQSQPEGAMLAVSLSEAELAERLPPGRAETGGLDLAAINASALCVVSGSVLAVERFHQQLMADGVNCRRLHTSRAFHSSMMTPILEAFATEVRSLKLNPPQIPYVSTTTGTFVTPAEATSPTYWAEQLRQPVKWADGIKNLASEPDLIFLEVGPGRGLSMLAKQEPAVTERVVLNSLRHPSETQFDSAYLLKTLGQLWLAGVAVDWKGYHAHERRRRLPLPTYPFERQRYFIDPPKDRGTSSRLATENAMVKQAPPDWFYVPSWERSATPFVPPVAPLAERAKRCVLLFLGESGVGRELHKRLCAAGHDVISVRRGPRFAKLDHQHYVLEPDEQEGYTALWQELLRDGVQPWRVVHLWTLEQETTSGAADTTSDLEATLEGVHQDLPASRTSPPSPLSNFAASPLRGEGEPDKPQRSFPPLHAALLRNAELERGLGGEVRKGCDFVVDTLLASAEVALSRGFYSLVALARMLGSTKTPVEIVVLTSNMQSVLGDELLCPEQATVLGAIRVIPQEYPHLRCRTIDLPLGKDALANTTLLDSLATELLADSLDGNANAGSRNLAPVVAYRGRHRWEQTFKQVRLEEMRPDPLATPADGLFRRGGTYLMTGGLGEIGLTIAETLAPLQVNLVLLGRSGFPRGTDIDAWLDAHAETDPISRKLRRIQAIEKAGAQVLVLSADVADAPQMRTALALVEQTFGSLHGVIHAAGITDPLLMHPMEALGVSECAIHFRPKVLGLLVLEALLRDKPLDFCILLSSVAAVLGGQRMAAYASANAFLDAFAHKQSQSSRTRWLSVNLYGWRTDAIARFLAVQENASIRTRLQTTLEQLSITPSEGVHALHLAATRLRDPQVILSAGSLHAQFAAWNGVSTPHPPSDTTEAIALAGNSRPSIKNVSAAPRSETEQAMIAIWQDLLGIPDIGTKDNFWELGGHSLLGTQLIARVRKHFQVALTLQTLFDEPTVLGLSAHVETMLRHGSGRPIDTFARPAPLADAEDGFEEGTL